MLKLAAANRGEATLWARSLWAAVACREHTSVTGGRHRYKWVLPIPAAAQDRGVVVPSRQRVARGCQGTALRGHADAWAPSSTSSPSCTTLRDGCAVLGRDLADMLYGTSYFIHLLFRVKLPLISPANLPRGTRKQHHSLWKRGGGSETRRLMPRSLRSLHFLFLVPPSVVSQQDTV